MYKNLFSVFIPLLILSSCTKSERLSSPEITAADIQTHITYLASDELLGREAGTAQEAIAANYIADLFFDYGLEPAGDDQTYFQSFMINTTRLRNPHTADSDTSGDKRMAKNVAAFLPGSSDSDNLIIIGAHYDHLGMGEFGSLDSRGPKIHNGADDNASGTAGLIELAEYFSANPIQSDILFLAFSGEEMGLLGSQYFVENPTVDLETATAMINMDMIGRMNNDKLLIFGVGTSEKWDGILNEANSDSLNLNLIPDGTGASDHTSFYFKNIPVLHYFTDTHADYHRPSDDVDYINFDGQAKILNHIVRVVGELDALSPEQFVFTEAPGEQRQNVTMSGPTLGVLPDYGYDGKGMKITGVTEGRAADNAGLVGGDIIIKIGENDLPDIYAYMESLNKYSIGDKTSITVLRDGEEKTMTLQF